MAASHELAIVHAEERVGGVDEVGVVDDFDLIARVIEQVFVADAVQYLVALVVYQIVGYYQGSELLRQPCRVRRRRRRQ